MAKYTPTKGDDVYVIYPEGKIVQREVYQPIHRYHCLIRLFKDDIFVEAYFEVNLFLKRDAALEALEENNNAILSAKLITFIVDIKDNQQVYVIKDNRLWMVIPKKYRYLGNQKHRIGWGKDKYIEVASSIDLFESKEQATVAYQRIKKENEKEKTRDKRGYERYRIETETAKINQGNGGVSKLRRKLLICQSCGIVIDDLGRSGCS